MLSADGFRLSAFENLSGFGLRTTLAPRTPPGRERSNGSGGGVCCGSVRSLAHLRESRRGQGLPNRAALEHNPASPPKVTDEAPAATLFRLCRAARGRRY